MNDKVLLLELRERTSANGNRYLSGWLGKAAVVAFLDREAEEPTWQVYVSTPQQKPAQRDGGTSRGASTTPAAGKPQGWRRDLPPQSAPKRGGRQPVRPGDLDDDVSDLGRGVGK